MCERVLVNMSVHIMHTGKCSMQVGCRQRLIMCLGKLSSKQNSSNHKTVLLNARKHISYRCILIRLYHKMHNFKFNICAIFATTTEVPYALLWASLCTLLPDPINLHPPPTLFIYVSIVSSCCGPL